MPAYEGTETVEIAAPPGACFDALTDYERLPDWQGPLRSCSVLSRDAQGRGEEVEYEVDAKVRRVRYRLRHGYEPGRRITSEYLDGDFEEFSGEWLFEPAGAGTRATVQIRLDPGVWLPGRIAKLVQKRVLHAAAEDLKQHLEAAPERASAA